MLSAPTAERLRFAVAAGNYGEVDRLLTEYRAEVESYWKEASAEERQLMARRTMNLLNWVRRTILAARAHAQHRHVQAVRQGAYVKPAVPRSAVDLSA